MVKVHTYGDEGTQYDEHRFIDKNIYLSTKTE
jgi:hypothetical protein